MPRHLLTAFLCGGLLALTQGCSETTSRIDVATGCGDRCAPASCDGRCDLGQGRADCGSCSTVLPASSDPVTTALTGSHATYSVGPGQTYAEPDKVPWSTLVAGDVVNIYYRPTAYKWKLCLRSKGTAAAPIVVNGVTSASGQRPKFDFNGASTPSACSGVFTTGQWSLEDYGGIVIRRGPNDAYPYKPGFLQIKNLELAGAKGGNSFVNLAGATMPYITSAGGIWIQPSTDIVLENNVVYDNAFGIFTMAKNSSLDEACERITVRACRVYGNGVVGSYLEHNIYMQSTSPVVEGNYLGVLRKGAIGSSYKSRSSGEIFRYNYVEASARAIDWVYAEDQEQGIAVRPDYGTDYAYGNIIVNDGSLPISAGYPIHYGGDNLGEQEDTATPITPPTTPYRSHLYFYNNTVVMNVPQSPNWRCSVFDLSLRETTVDAWNNIFFFQNTSHYAWVQYAGKLKLHGTNLVYGASVADASDQALAVNYTVSKLGTLLDGNPSFVSATDFHPGAGSAAIDKATGLPAGVNPAASYVQIPVALEPGLKANGLLVRTQKGAALDLGALEAK